MSKNKLISAPVIKKRGRPPKIALQPQVAKKRGRPPKVKVTLEVTKQVTKGKRGRPKKVLVEKPSVEEPKKRRGRPPKLQCVKDTKNKLKSEYKKFEGKAAALKKPTVEEVHASTLKDFVEARAFLSKKEASKQVPEFKKWLEELNQVAVDDNKKRLVQLIPQLATMINRVLEEQSLKDQIQVHIYVLKYMVDEEIKVVEFEPFEKGIKCRIFYSLKGLPIGLAKKQKDDIVCNKINSAVEKFVPIGFCC
jgi:hypothetical protein